VNEKFVDQGYGKKLIGCYVVGMPLAAAGLALCATIVFSPVGFLLLIAAGTPLYLLQKNHMRRMQEWQNRDHPMQGQGMPPWLTPSTRLTSDGIYSYETERVEPDA
jgi:fatty acid desaturase